MFVYRSVLGELLLAVFLFLRMTSSGAAGGVLQQVNQLWSMLDNLCENDPKAYSRFIHRQVDEAVAANAPPQLYSCISTWLLVSNHDVEKHYYWTVLRAPCLQWLYDDILLSLVVF